MSEFSSYYLYQRYEKRGNQDWIPCYPNVYSISGDSSNPMTLVMKEENDPQCGYTPVIVPQYRWNVVDGFMCANCDPTKAMIHTSATTIYISGSGEITQAEVSGYTSAATDVVITSDATSIGNNAFSGFSGVEFIRMPNSVTSIGDNAFYGCSAMTECQIPYGVLSIGNSAFTNSISLMFVDIPNSVTSLGNGCFKNCLNFRYASIPTSIHDIPSECFYNCDGLSDIEIPSSVSGLGDSAFAECSGLYSVTVNNTTPPTLGTSAFTNTNANLKIYVPCESVDNYKAASGWSTFGNRILPILNTCNAGMKFNAKYNNGDNYIELCDSYTSITTATTQPSDYVYSAMTSAQIGDCVTSIGYQAFSRCYSLTSCTIGSGVTSIGTFAFRYCSGLTSIDMPDSVTTIGSSAFDHCTSLTSCTIGSGITTIGIWAFGSCTSLKRLNSDVDGVFNIPSGITSLGKYAFYSCSGATSCTIGSGITTIGDGTFSDCTSLKRLNSDVDGVFNIPSGITSLGEYAFYLCSGMTNCTMGTSVTTIGEYTFFECYGLTSIDIPDSVTNIGDRAFYYCTSLTSITCLATTPPTLGSEAFNNTNTNLKIYVPSSSVDIYKTSSGWSDYANKINPIE